VGDFLELTKPRVVAMVLVSTAAGFYLGSEGARIEVVALLNTLFGTALAAAGTVALNQVLEREADGRMARTRRRPLPDGRLAPREAWVFGVAITAGGLAHLTLAVSALCGLITALIVSSYLFLYTPLKQRTPLCTVVGAIPGALPPVTGWAAARGEVGLEAWVLFAILFLWQLPHSLAIALMYRDDYARAGFRLLPVVEPDGRSTGRQIVNTSLALLTVGMMPTLIGLAGPVYFATALASGAVVLWFGVETAARRSPAVARRLLHVTLVYLPVVLALMALDKVAPL
jgi:protoheme IX farnesyltransferase